ncbi:unnamed protein product [Rotaria magnacalcarata]|uniref:Uncharacterized protein n=2 Tax=Rotaria magnacalcarata TaxID=392030 RepID=A0A815QR25_9BILA|nr:unnamed protein product [Rotaria magnacalcarata]CAF3946427.1 unnamed protein product [Rotaria magnacalcarata]
MTVLSLMSTKFHQHLLSLLFKSIISLLIQTTIDIHTQLHLWKETFYFRRQSIGDRSTADVLKDFSGYGNSLLVFKDVKMLMKIDLTAAVRRQILKLLEKVLETTMFITDSPPI